MDKVTLRNQAYDGTLYEAVFSSSALCLLSFKKGTTEVIDKTFASAPIGPHYDRRNAAVIGGEDPYAFGISRYAPWEIISTTDSSFKAALNGKQQWQDQALSSLEGQPFVMTMHATLGAHGLDIFVSVVSDSDSLTGWEYCCHLPNGSGFITSDVKENYLEGKDAKPIPEKWKSTQGNRLHLDLSHPASATFHPFLNPLEGNIHINTSAYQLGLNYQCICQENCWQVIKEPENEYVRLRLLSAKMPHRPSLTVSSLNISLEILPT